MRETRQRQWIRHGIGGVILCLSIDYCSSAGSSFGLFLRFNGQENETVLEGRFGEGIKEEMNGPDNN